MKHIWCVFLVLLLYGNVYAQSTIPAESCSKAHVDAAIALSVTGDTVTVPIGECTWDATVTIPNNKKITLSGAGMTSTIITRSPGGVAIALGQSGSRVTGLGFVEGTISVDGDGWRIDHCKFYNASTFRSSVDATGYRDPAKHPTGLIDNSEFFNGRVVVFGANSSLGYTDWEHEIWAEKAPLGSGNGVVYIEDCVFDFTPGINANAVDSNYGGRFVFRFNETINSGIAGLVDNHSVQGLNRASQLVESYHNDLDNQGENVYYPYRIRAGTGVIFNDTLAGNWSNYGIAFDNVRSFANMTGSGFCDGSSDWDGNEGEGAEAGYPCRDQIGRGYDTVQWDHDPPEAYTQVLMPFYLWNNRRASNNAVVPVHVINSSDDHVQANRDYYDYNESFNGTAGTGTGTLSARPATCTTGVGYWATDQGSWNKSGSGGQGVLYTCTSTDTWAVYYTPYEYPHPLRGESTPSISAPSGLRVVGGWSWQ